MIIDAHAHVFPHFEKAAGFRDARVWRAQQQNDIARLWGRMVSNTLDPSAIPDPGEEVNFRFGKYGRFYWTKHGRECWLQRFPTLMTEMEWTPEQMIASMDAVGVEKALLQAGYMETNYCRQYFTECMGKYPDRFIGTVSIDYDIEKPGRYRDQELEKLRAAARQGMGGVFQGFPRQQREVMDDDRFNPFWGEMARLGVPHIFITGFRPKRDYLRSLSCLERVLRKFPDLRGVIGHLGGNIRPPGDPNDTDTPEELMRILKLPNAYFEVGYVLAYENWEIWKEDYEYPYPLHTRLIKRIYDEIGAERLLWASDIPNIYRTCTYRQCFDLVRLHFDFLAEEEKGQVLGGNAAGLFKIERSKESSNILG
jgi:predicted TIM-barrel fold metal-dependent hydrolase